MNGLCLEFVPVLCTNDCTPTHHTNTQSLTKSVSDTAVVGLITGVCLNRGGSEDDRLASRKQLGSELQKTKELITDFRRNVHLKHHRITKTSTTIF